MPSVADYSVLFDSTIFLADPPNQGNERELELGWNIPTNFVNGTNRAQPILSFEATVIEDTRLVISKIEGKVLEFGLTKPFMGEVRGIFSLPNASFTNDNHFRFRPAGGRVRLREIFFAIKSMFERPMIYRVVLAALMIALFAGSTEARTHRSCDAQYVIDIKQRDTVSEFERRLLGASWTARRGCGNAVPNRCRRRATSAIKKCVEVHWDTRWRDRRRPSHCTSAEGITGYPLNDIKADLERGACCAARSRNARDVWVELRIEIDGNVDCGGHNVRPVTFPVSSPRYRVNCAAWRETNSC
ncbi:MAG: hypothetical protein AAF718_15140 [Pseudomonadota bacterium]